MGLFGAIRQIRNAVAAGGNFAFIAQNITATYIAIQQTPFGKSLNDNQLLYATGIIDAIAYLRDGTATCQDISDAVMLANIGAIRIGPYMKHHTSFSAIEDNKELIGLTMQMETLIFSIDTKTDYHVIVDTVIEQKPVITNMVNKTIEEGNKCNIYNQVISNVTRICAAPWFQNEIGKFSIPYSC